LFVQDSNAYPHQIGDGIGDFLRSLCTLLSEGHPLRPLEN